MVLGTLLCRGSSLGPIDLSKGKQSYVASHRAQSLDLFC